MAVPAGRAEEGGDAAAIRAAATASSVCVVEEAVPALGPAAPPLASYNVRPAEPRDAAGIAASYMATWEEHRTELLGACNAGGSGVRAPNGSAPATSSKGAQIERFERMVAAGERSLLVAEADVCIVGFLSYGPSVMRPGESGEVMQLFVHPAHQRRGVGSMLLVRAEAAMFASWPEAHVWVTRGAPSRFFYERLGWAASGLEKELVPSMAAVPVPVVEYRKGRPAEPAPGAASMTNGLMAAAAA